jgi:putative copper export protein
MKYDQEEAVREILKRKDAFLIRRVKKTIRSLSYASAAITAMLVAVVVRLTDMGNAWTDQSVYGAFLLSKEAGGYVLIGVLAFALGIVFTLLCMQSRKLKMQKEVANKKHEMEEGQ